MSIVRWCAQEDGKISDVYIYYHVNGGITCHSSLNCALDFNVPTVKELQTKLKQEEFKDHHIPEFVFNLEEDEE